MDQLNLFDEVETAETFIPEDVISPVECSNNVKSVAFRKNQERWYKYTEAIQRTHKCTWFEARKLLIDHRNSQKPIELQLVE